MKREDLRGLYSALLTSFDENGNINEQGIREIIRHNIDQMKVDGLYVGGSTGENFLISFEEKKEIFRIAKEEAKGDVKLIAQVGALNIHESVELAKYATELGYDAISAVTPFYYKFSFEEIKDYYNTISASCDNDLIVYSIPFLTGVNISVEQFGELFENERIVGVKFTAADFYLLERLRKAYPEHLIYAGFDEMMLPAATLGIDGAIGSTFNVNGVRARQILELVGKGDIKGALEVQHVTNDLISAILGNGLYATIKELLEIQGVHAGYCKKPMSLTTQEQKVKAREIYDLYLA